MSDRVLHLAFDATACLGTRTGVGRFATEVLARLGRRDDIDTTAFAVSWRGRNTLSDVVPDGVHVANRPMAARPLRLAWRSTGHPTIERWTGPIDVVHGPNFVVPPTRAAARVVTVHDLTPVRYPELSTRDTLEYPGLVQRAIDDGAWVHTHSSFVAAEIIEHFGARPERVVVVPSGVTPLVPSTPTSDAARGRQIAGATRYVLALGTIEPRKDLPALVEAFDLLALDDADLHLVVAGPDGWGIQAFRDAVAAATNRDRIVAVGRVDEETRAALLRGAALLAFPSRYEGFGLPPLEAMAAGTPVVSTDAGALAEVLGDAAELVPARLLAADRPAGIEALAASLARVLADEDRRTALIAAGLERSARFTWDATADRLADLYHRAAQHRSW